MQWKKRMALACAGVMLLSMVGCSGSGSTVTDSETVSQASSEQAQTEGDTIEHDVFIPHADVRASGCHHGRNR